MRPLGREVGRGLRAPVDERLGAAEVLDLPAQLEERCLEGVDIARRRGERGIRSGQLQRHPKSFVPSRVRR